MAMTADAIIFAINSAIRLGRNAQRAYAKSLTSRSIVLPLPQFSGEPNEDTARRFFEDTDPEKGGAQYLKKMERVADIHRRFISIDPEVELPSDEELEFYIKSYLDLNRLLLEQNSSEVDFQKSLDEEQINVDDVLALLSIRQYTDPKAVHTNPLQMVAGTIVELGIDYFNQIPGALNTESAKGKAIKQFLNAFDGMKFSDNAALKSQSKNIVPQLFIAATETVSGLSDEITNDPKFQGFIRDAGRGIAKDLAVRLEGLTDVDNQEEAVRWGQLLLRSTISNAGSYVFASPQNFFRTNEAGGDLIKATSGVLLDAILQDPDKLNLKAGFNSETLDKLLQSSFGVLAEHPKLAGGKNKGFQAIVQGVSNILKDYHFKRPDLFPEMVRIVLEQTGKHLQFFWRPTQQGGPGDTLPLKNKPQDLLLQALKLILQEVSTPVQDGKWRPRLSKSQLLFITESLLAEVVDNPAWVERQVDGKPLLALVVRTTIDGLAQLPQDNRLSATTFRMLLELNLRTVAANELVLTKIKWSTDTEEKAVLERALNLVFAFVFDKDTTTPGDRFELLSEILDYVLEVVVSRHPNSKGIMMVNLILSKDTGVGFSGGFDRNWANTLIDAALSTLAAHPDLLINDQALSSIISGVAGALNASSFKDPNFTHELIRLSLENTALNAGLIVNSNSDKPEYLLVNFIKELLLAISTKDSADGKWQPNLTPAEALSIVDNLVGELIQHPEWIVKGPDGQVIFTDVMTAVRSALQNVPPGASLNPAQLQYLLALALQAAATSQVVLNKIPWGDDVEKRTILERALGLVSNFVFKQNNSTGGEQLARFADVVEYVLEGVMSLHPNRSGLLMVQLILFGDNDIDYSQGFDADLADELMESGLSVLQQRPDLVSKDQALQSIVSDLAGSLDANDFRQQGILPELVRLGLQATASNAQLVVNVDTDNPSFLMVIAMKSMIGQLVSKPADSAWHPQLNGDSMLILAESLVDELVQHPQWVIPPSDTTPTLWAEVLDTVMTALRKLPADARLTPDVLENMIKLSLYTAANSPTVMDKITWGDNTQEKTILNNAIAMLVEYIYPQDSTASPGRLARFIEMLDYIMEVVIDHHPDKRSLLILDLLLFESEVDLSQGFDRNAADDLVDAALGIMQAHPDLLAKDEIFKKILSDTAGALRASRTDVEHLLPEFIRILLSNASGHLEGLMKVTPNSPRILLAVALEQVLRVVTQPASTGKWRPTLTDDQLLMVVETVMERVVARPEWVGKDKLIQLTLRAIYTALGELRRGQHLPFDTVMLLIEAGLDAVGQRQQLVLQVITENGNDSVVLEYALGKLMFTLYNENGETAGSWTLTETDTLHTLLSAYLLRLAAGPADEDLTKELLQKIKDAIDQINNNLTFAIEDLLAEIEEA